MSERSTFNVLPRALRHYRRALAAGGAAQDSLQSLVDVYDMNRSLWTTSHLSIGRRGMASVSVGNLVLFAGGVAGTTLSDVIDIYNANSGNWSVAKLSYPRHSITAVASGNKVLFGGGMYDLNTGNVTSTVDIFEAR